MVVATTTTLIIGGGYVLIKVGKVFTPPSPKNVHEEVITIPQPDDVIVESDDLIVESDDLIVAKSILSQSDYKVRHPPRLNASNRILWEAMAKEHKTRFEKLIAGIYEKIPQSVYIKSEEELKEAVVKALMSERRIKYSFDLGGKIKFTYTTEKGNKITGEANLYKIISGLTAAVGSIFYENEDQLVEEIIKLLQAYVNDNKNAHNN